MKKKVYSTLINDSDDTDPKSLRSLIGRSLVSSVYWHSLPRTPVYPILIYRRLNTDQDQLFDFISLKSPMTFEISLFDDTPSPEKLDKIKDRVIELFHRKESSLSDTHIHFYSSSIVSDIGDAFLDGYDRWFTTIRLEFVVVKVCEIINNM